MTYKKPLKDFSGTTLMGVSINARDTATSRIGNDAIEAFKAHKTIKTEANGRKVLTPFHAVKKAMYGVFTEDAERTDPYCTDGDTATITVRSADDGRDAVIGTFKVAKGTKLADVQDANALGEEDCERSSGLCGWEDARVPYVRLGEDFVITEDITIIPSCCR